MLKAARLAERKSCAFPHCAYEDSRGYAAAPPRATGLYKIFQFIIRKYEKIAAQYQTPLQEGKG